MFLKTVKNVSLTVLLILSFVSISFAGGRKPSPPPTPAPEAPAQPQIGGAAADLYRQGKELADQNKHAEALAIFVQANDKQPNDPDVLNMLAHCQLKTGSIDESLTSYKKALEIKPNFPEAREYLGEAYLAAALREVATLKSYGKEGEEQLEDLEKEFKEAAEKVE